MTDEEAEAILKEMRWRAGTIFRALDQDGDGMLSPVEIDNASIVLRSLDSDGDGFLTEADFGGPTLIPGLVRRSGIVRLLDEDGDLIIRPQDIESASDRILMLDSDGDGCVSAEDDLPQPGANVENRMPMGTPAQTLAYQQKMFGRSPGVTGRLPPSGRADVQPGLLLIHEVNDRSDVQKSGRTFLMDEHGRTVHAWPARDRSPEATVAYLLPTGNLLRTSCKHGWQYMDGQFPIGANGTISIVAPDGTVLWEWTHFEPGAEALHHDVEIMPNGNILALSWAMIEAAEAVSFGWQRQQGHDRIVLDKVYELAPDLDTGAGRIVWEWSARDHLVQNADPFASNFGDPAESIDLIDVNWPRLSEVQFNTGQLFHMNSVSYHAAEDLILLSSAVFGEIWIIDHSTTTEEARGDSGGRQCVGGNLVWRWGNPQTRGQGGPDDQVLYWQHDAHFLPFGVPGSGDLLLFNNGMRRNAEGRPDPDQICMGLLTGAYSEALELTLPKKPDGLIWSGRPPKVEWRFNSDAGLDFYTPFMGGVQRMPNGNTLMLQAYDKRIVEIAPDGSVVMDFNVGGPGRMFRIYKYPPDHPGIRAIVDQ